MNNFENHLEGTYIPYTGGRFYTFVERDVFEDYFDKIDDESLEDLTVGETYTFFRVVKDQKTDEVLFVKITGEIISINETEMVFIHTGTLGKVMSLDNFLENWFFMSGKV